MIILGQSLSNKKSKLGEFLVKSSNQKMSLRFHRRTNSSFESFSSTDMLKLSGSNSPTSSAKVSPNKSQESFESKQIRDFSSLLSSPMINITRIRSISWAGVPSRFRATVWRLLLDYEPANQSIKKSALEHKRNDYFDCLNRVYSETQKKLWTSALKATQDQILRDLPRTKDSRFRSKEVQDIFERVLFVWAVRHPASGYVQGMNDLLQPFFYVFLNEQYGINSIEELSNFDDKEEKLREIEADSFWCFSKLLDGLQDLYTRDQPGLYKMMEKLQQVVARVDPELANWIEEEGIQYQEFAFRWLNCLLVREFEMPLLLRLWDSYLANSAAIANTHVYVCAAMLTKMAAVYHLKGESHAEFVIKIQQAEAAAWTTTDMDEIIAQAYVYEKMFSQAPAHFKNSNSLPHFPTGK
ncbi:TBC domain containing protein [Tritrichomonas foetus]|uniref:TBC domain containing protein n=1 Tax=Tritrichomonas foetus TaxID=1144522 RepID=A0A1J4KHP9_9EUKA|nr:TBC domain containing protein [Tritrichomonas foetus]|eukprot:OHT09182.1 TBC domain containing protein [Tritrichomonas foetus]